MPLLPKQNLRDLSQESMLESVRSRGCEAGQDPECQAQQEIPERWIPRYGSVAGLHEPPPDRSGAWCIESDKVDDWNIVPKCDLKG
jgi:hypothetical protein